MIVTKLQGGLGNQLFQWATTRSLSLLYETDSFYNLDYFNGNGWELDIKKFNNVKIQSYSGNYETLSLITDDFNYNANIQNETYLKGYWQSEKYFQDIRNIILEDLEFDVNLVNYINDKYDLVSSNSVSIHVRRGDYIKSNGYHPVQNIEYYKNSYDSISGVDNVFVFSDDIEWCKDNIKFDNTTFIEGGDNISDMCMMSLCKNNIIANSSFSWWGAWLNNNPEKIVFAPSKWFGDGVNLHTGDIIPKKWIIN